VPSPNVATYDLKPEMSCHEVANEVISALKNSDYKLIVVNFANGDMVGHTAKKEPIIKAMEHLDRAIGKIITEAIKNDVAAVITADHGNVDEIMNRVTGLPNTQHSMNPVPCIIVDRNNKWSITKSGGLSNIAPTVLKLMNIDPPGSMTSESLIK